jgi:hypothetical protein
MSQQQTLRTRAVAPAHSAWSHRLDECRALSQCKVRVHKLDVLARRRRDRVVLARVLALPAGVVNAGALSARTRVTPQ